MDSLASPVTTALCTVKEIFPLAAMAPLDGVRLSEKRLGPTTSKLPVAACEPDAAAPVTVNERLAMLAVLESTERVRVVLPPAVTVASRSEAWTPGGSVPTVSAICSAAAEATTAVAMVQSAEPPGARWRSAGGVSVRVKSPEAAAAPTPTREVAPCALTPLAVPVTVKVVLGTAAAPAVRWSVLEAPGATVVDDRVPVTPVGSGPRESVMVLAKPPMALVFTV